MTVEPNPYLAPSAASGPPQLPHTRLKWVYLIALVAPFVFSVLGLASNALALVFGILGMLALLAAPVSYLLWVARTWSLLPERTSAGTSPAAAAGYHLIPGYNVIWVFACNIRIARGLREALQKYPTRLRAPVVLGYLAPGLPLLGALLGALLIALAAGSPGPPPAAGAPPHPSIVMMFLPFLALAPFLWFAWMARVDNCQQEILFQRAAKKKARQRVNRPD